MTRIAALCLAALVAFGPTAAQEAETAPEANLREGMDLLGQGMRLLFRGLGDELEPALRDLAETMQPALRRLIEIVDDFDAYQMPERLPNGDIIIRRKPDAPPVPPTEDIEI
ncbi:AAA+ family ATPase [Rhodovulum strictum]|uniref:AAA+ family ATPase n=1 Tax=Rhodovulum strictum TaxID=58314 RepID=A0A844BAN5_9RHOB|nr:AAA+ family ATPase [Rhodovulum strictum]MRH21484.1 AAA+ family ATPase [Rhodovulum strictum]